MRRPSLVPQPPASDVVEISAGRRLAQPSSPQDIERLERTACHLFKATHTARTEETWWNTTAVVRRWYRRAARRALGFLAAADLLQYRHPPEEYDEDR